MIITINKKAKQSDVDKLRALLDQNGLGHCHSENERHQVLGVEKNGSEELIKTIKGSSIVEDVITTKTPFKLAGKEYKNTKTLIQIKDVVIGGNDVVLMAGPCAIESLEQLLAISSEMKKMGVKVLRGSAYKPRTSPYSFQGTGVEGLKWHKQAQIQHGLLIETEVMDVRDVEIVAEHVDIVRVGARNMQNFNLLKEVGKCSRPVILKRGMSSTVEEWLMSAEYIMAHGNHNVILCERGIRTFETTSRNTLDLNSVAVVKNLSHLPVIVDPSHAAGKKDIIPHLAKAAVAVGADGLLIEVHHDPKSAKCDPLQALIPSELDSLRKELKLIAQAIGRDL